MRINALGYVGFESPNFEEFESFGPEIFGFELGETGADGTVSLRMDDRKNRISIHPGNEDRLAYLGWEVPDVDEFKVALKELEGHGLDAELGTKAEAQQRGVREFVRFHDPSGYVHEVFWGALFMPGTFRPGRAMSGGFVGGAQGVGHAVLVIPEFTKEHEWFVYDVLGFQLFGDMTRQDDQGRTLGTQFYRCNPRTHCMGYLSLPNKRGVHHLCIESESLDDVGRAYDTVQEREVPLWMTLGRHSLDELVSFYCRTPGGFNIEFGAGGVMLDDETHTMQHPLGPEVWGHKRDDEGGWPTTVKDLSA